MIRLAIMGQDGKVLTPKDVPTAAELLNLVEQARGIIRECERMAQQMKSQTASGNVPYLT